jgi:hypothetical protein
MRETDRAAPGITGGRIEKGGVNRESALTHRPPPPSPTKPKPRETAPHRGEQELRSGVWWEGFGAGFVIGGVICMWIGALLAEGILS